MDVNTKLKLPDISGKVSCHNVQGFLGLQVYCYSTGVKVYTVCIHTTVLHTTVILGGSWKYRKQSVKTTVKKIQTTF